MLKPRVDGQRSAVQKAAKHWSPELASEEPYHNALNEKLVKETFTIGGAG